jgi:hypothetical protein
MRTPQKDYEFPRRPAAGMKRPDTVQCSIAPGLTTTLSIEDKAMATHENTPHSRAQRGEDQRTLYDLSSDLEFAIIDLETFVSLLDFIRLRDGSADGDMADPIAALTNALRTITYNFRQVEAGLHDYRAHTKEGGVA